MSTFHLTTETISIIIKEPPTVDECETNLHTHQVGLRVFQEPSKVGILIYQMNIFTIAFQTEFCTRGQLAFGKLVTNTFTFRLPIKISMPLT